MLIVGHQTSIPRLINKICKENKYGKISADDYDNLYKVVIDEDGKIMSSKEDMKM